MVIVAVAMGIAKGIRTVYMSLVIPSYIPIERLASASGIQMFTNGIFLLLLGPVLGTHARISLLLHTLKKNNTKPVRKNG